MTPYTNRATVLLVLTITGLSTSSSTPTTQEPKAKRQIYENSFVYGTTSSPVRGSQLEFFKAPLSTDADLFSTDLNRKLFSSNADQFGIKIFSSYPQLSQPSFGYDYPKPVTQFYEEPVPQYIDVMIQPAIQPRMQANLPQSETLRSNLEATYRQRRLITPVNEDLFFKYPAYVPENSAVRVKVPIGVLRPSRLVVPQHGVLAVGSGGLGYSMLPGGRIALGSGSRGYFNIVRARNNLLPPIPLDENGKRIPTPQQPLPSSFLRREDASTNVAATAPSNSLTVFPQNVEDLSLNWQN